MVRSTLSSGAKFLPCITYQTLFGGRPVHYHLEPTDQSVEWRQLEKCESPECRALITNCHCGFVYRLDAIENWIKKEQPALLQLGDIKLPKREDGCEMCSNTCSRCHQNKKGEPKKLELHVYKGIERRLCPAHAKMGDPAKHQAEARDDLNKAVLIFQHLWSNPDHLSRIRGQGGYDAFIIYQRQANDARTNNQPHPDISTFVKEYLDKQQRATPSKAARGPGSVDIVKNESPEERLLPLVGEEPQEPWYDNQLPPASDPEILDALNWFNRQYGLTDQGEATNNGVNGEVAQYPHAYERATSVPLPPNHAPELPRLVSDPVQHLVPVTTSDSAALGYNVGVNHMYIHQSISDPVTRSQSANPLGYRENISGSDEEEDDISMEDPLPAQNPTTLDPSYDWVNKTEREVRKHMGLSPPREMSGDSGMPSAVYTSIVTPITYPGTIASTVSPPAMESLLYDFEISAGIQRLAGSFMSKYPEWQRNVYKTIQTADPDSGRQLPDHLEVADVEHLLDRLPKILYKGFFDTIPTAYVYDVNAACIKLLANQTPSLPKKDDPYNTPLPRSGMRRHYFDTVTLHFGQFSIERDGRLIDPERVHLRWVHECMSWVVCEVLEGGGHPTRILNLLEAQVNLLLDLKDTQGSRMVHRARIDCAHQGCPLHCDYTRIFTGVIAIVVITAERACLQAYRSKQWDELDKRRKVFYQSMKVAAKLMDCNSVNFYRILEQLENPNISPEERENQIIRCKIYDGIIEKIDRLYLTFIDYGVMQKEHDDIEREFLKVGGKYYEWSSRYAQRELDFAKSWNEFNEYANDPMRPMVPCHELFTIPKDQMATSPVLRRWEEYVGKDYLRDEDIPIKEVYDDDDDADRPSGIKRPRGE
uniref:Uncharacterized protein n=1 Tax=Kwoniella bestiolae CBS 10118 TaxID=1296100 RepID=A0A1B9G3E8_9TREE|nr:hypothetical protein I302_05375 [Kwoniella bestiolae CBS 10118]OCF25555.1 hypothetical protein I302_05375 [Kwoniella bestiolae CBS 10118]